MEKLEAARRESMLEGQKHLSWTEIQLKVYLLMPNLKWKVATVLYSKVAFL